MDNSVLKSLKEFISIIQTTNLKRLFYLSFFLFIGILIESFGLGMLYPIIDLLVNDNSDNIILGYNFESKSNKIFFLLGSVFIIYLVKTFYLILLTAKQSQFISFTTENLSNEIFTSYIFSPYKFHIKNNSSELVKNIQVELSNFTTYLSSIIYIISDLILIFAVVGTLIYLNTVGTILLMIYIILGSLFFLRYTKKKLKIWGDDRLKIDSKLSLTLNEVLRGIITVKISNLESIFLTKFKKENSVKYQYYWKQMTLGQIPRLYIEIISILGFISLIFISLKESFSLLNFIPILSIYLAAFFRILPSINRILSSYQQLIYYSPSVFLINSQLENNRLEKSKRYIISSFKKQISLNNISFKYEDKYILKNFNLKIDKGKIYGIKGKSGSGKSTLASIITGLLEPNEGKILIDDKEYQNFRWGGILSYVSQHNFIFDKTIIENITLGYDKNQLDLNKVQKVLKQANILEYINSLEKNFYTNLGENAISFSGGQIQRLVLARALYNNPKLLVLDEFTSALDNENENKLYETIKNLKNETTIIIISHRDNLVKVCDEILDLNELNTFNN